ncbi:ATP-binding protein [Lutibacter sp. A80]|uniref:tetratricopeptide repeat-containing sensor histidine kinase n=1 Tax=Lutibacter sp. A80 TaxID=2918453 RepID=UPI001F051564|nr:HAMP domain-containing sensor histidine kinase [Lutibacter sp. A80]UMB61077.1 ATP-binding protein [Lutibacter sp. A80]
MPEKYFFIIFCSVIISFSFGNLEQDLNNSQRIKATQKTEQDQIALQLDSALNMVNVDSQKTLKIAKYCLEQSKQNKNKFLQMRSNYILGRAMYIIDSLNYSKNYLNTALDLSEDLDDNWYKGEILNRIAIIQYRFNETKLALETFNDALYYSQESKNYKAIGSSYSMIGTIFRVNGVYSRAIEYFIKSRLNYRKANFNEGDAWVAYLLGQVNSDLRNSEKALKYFKEALGKYHIINSIDGNTNGLAMCYEQIALLNLEFGNLDDANKNIDILLKIYSKTNSKYGLSSSYSLLGKLEYLKGNYKLAEQNLYKSLDIKNKYLNLHGRSSIFEYLGLCAIKLGRFNEGIKKINQGLEIALSTKSKKNQLDIYSKLANIYLDVNDYKKAVYYQNKQIEVQDLILFGEADIQTEQLQTFYELDEKNQEINQLKKEKEVNILKIERQGIYQILMGLVILIIIVIAIVIYLFYKKLQHKNDELSILNTTKNKIFTIIAHDLRSPFNTILGFSDLLSSNAKRLDINKIIKFSQHINLEATNTLTLLDNLLNWAKSQTKQISFNPTELNIKPIITQILEELNSTAELKNISLNYTQLDDLKVYADTNMLKTILRNLITNAIKFTYLEGSVTVTTKVKNNFVEISISDTGMGMSDETRNKLFTLQTNESTTGTANEKGSGLGLVLCKEFIEKHGGNIWVTSELGKGTTFYFSLPNEI